MKKQTTITHQVCKWVFFIFLTSCQPATRHVTPSFYHWQTNLDLSKEEQHLLKKLQVEKIYAKFFDVDWQNNAPAPAAEIILNPASILDSISIIPTIYITNQTFKNLSDNQLPTLVKNIADKIKSLSTQLPDYQWTEIQFDCDWTLTTKDKYFQFLETIRKEFPLPVKLSATIRLHQIKYKHKTGIPPVDRGVLMFYNTGDLKEWTGKNTILEINEAQKYITNLNDYELDLDLALPIFNWGVIYREDRLFKLINGLNTIAVSDTMRFNKINEHRYEVIKSTYLGGHYLYKNDKIRLEQISSETLNKAVELLTPLMNNNDFQLLFYHLDSTTIAHHSYDELYEIQQKFLTQ